MRRLHAPYLYYNSVPPYCTLGNVNNKPLNKKRKPCQINFYVGPNYLRVSHVVFVTYASWNRRRTLGFPLPRKYGRPYLLSVNACTQEGALAVAMPAFAEEGQAVLRTPVKYENAESANSRSGHGRPQAARKSARPGASSRGGWNTGRPPPPAYTPNTLYQEETPSQRPQRSASAAPSRRQRFQGLEVIFP